MKKLALLTLASLILSACGGGGGGSDATDGGFNGAIKPELNISVVPGTILPNPTTAAYESLSSDASAWVTIYARQGNVPVENGDEELHVSINDAIGNVSGRIYCFELDNSACTTEETDSNGNTVTVLQPLGKVQLDLASGRGHFAVTASGVRDIIGNIGINITVNGPNNSVASEDILIPVAYPSTGNPYNVSITASSAINPNVLTPIYVAITDESGNPVSNPENDNILVTATGTANPLLGLDGQAATGNQISLSSKTDNGVATLYLTARQTGLIRITAQADSDNDMTNATTNLVSDTATITVTDDYIPPTQDIIITTNVVPSGVVNLAYNDFTIPTTGSSPVSFILSAGYLPSGMSLSSRGVLSGTPLQTGSFTFTVQVTGANGSTDTQEFTLSVVEGGLSFSPLDLGSYTATRTTTTTTNATTGATTSTTTDTCEVVSRTLTVVAADGYSLVTPFTWKMDDGSVKTVLGTGNNSTTAVTANGVSLRVIEFSVSNDSTQVLLHGEVCPTSPSSIFGSHAVILSVTDGNGFTYESILPLVLLYNVVNK